MEKNDNYCVTLHQADAHRKAGGVCRPLPQTLTPLTKGPNDQSLRFLPRPFLWPAQKFDTLFMSFAAGTVTPYIINVGLLVAVFLIIMKR